MIWQNCELLKLEESGQKDRLNNPIYKSNVILKTTCRSSPWTVEEMEMLSRQGAKNSLRFILKNEYAEEIKNADFLRIGDVDYSIKSMIFNLPRYCVLEVERYGN